MARWSPALRMARRDLRRHPGRTLLVLVLVMLPLAAATCLAVVQHQKQWVGENSARPAMGGADAQVNVTEFARIRNRHEYGGTNPRPASFTPAHKPVTRPASSVDVAALLPRGSRVVPAPELVIVRLAAGGQGQATVTDSADPITIGLVQAVTSGHRPTGAHDVVVSRAMASELGLLSGDRIRPGATVDLADGTRLRLVGLSDDTARGALLLVAPGSVLATHATPTSYLVDLPQMLSVDLHNLDRSLAGHGVSLLPRDQFLHPAAWERQQSGPRPVDAGAVAIGVVAVMLGLLEVVLLVGATFAVGARRQVRELGLLSSTGGGPIDVRRVLLAQGVVLGVMGSLAGVGAGLVLSPVAVHVYEQVKHTTLWNHDLPWTAVATIAALGSVTGFVAALVPAYGIARLTPVAALEGHFPLKPGESRAHRAAFTLAGAGLLMLGLGGTWAASAYDRTARASRPPYYTPSQLPVALCALGLLLLMAGVVWSAPYGVRMVARLGHRLPLSGRYAFRDAARHRFRAAAAAVTLTVTVAGSVFAGFYVAALQGLSAVDHVGPPHLVTAYLDGDSTRASPSDVTRAAAAIHTVLGPADVYAAWSLAPSGTQEPFTAGPPDQVTMLAQVDEATLRTVVGDDARALAAYRRGDLVTTDRFIVRNGQVRIGMDGIQSPRGAKDLHLPAVVVPAGVRLSSFGSAFVSPAAARSLGLTPVMSALDVVARRTVTSGDLARLQVRGISAWSSDPEVEQLTLARNLLLAGVALVTLLVAGVAVALAAAEGRDDTATLAAVGAGPGRRRRMGAAHGLFLGVVGVLLGLVVGVPAGAAVMQADGLPGIAVPWAMLGGVVLVVPLLAAAAGWVVTPTRLTLVRRTG